MTAVKKVKKTYQVILSTGEVVQEKSVKDYTHAVCGIIEEGMPEQLLSLCGSLILAEKQKAHLSGTKTFKAFYKVYIAEAKVL